MSSYMCLPPCNTFPNVYFDVISEILESHTIKLYRDNTVLKEIGNM